MKGKKPNGATERILVNPSDLNSDWSMHGGQLFYYMDQKAAIVARRHSGYVCHTVAGSPFKFFNPVNTKHVLTIKARITKAWNTSMEIRVEAYRKALRGNEEDAMTIYLYFVAVEGDTLKRVPAVIPQTKEDIDEYNLADERREKVKSFIEEYIGGLKQRRKERRQERIKKKANRV